MLKSLLITAVVVGITVLIVKSKPDIDRYLRMRAM